jgi:hypothetical protein
MQRSSRLTQSHDETLEQATCRAFALLRALQRSNGMAARLLVSIQWPRVSIQRPCAAFAGSLVAIQRSTVESAEPLISIQSSRAEAAQPFVSIQGSNERPAPLPRSIQPSGDTLAPLPHTVPRWTVALQRPSRTGPRRSLVQALRFVAIQHSSWAIQRSKDAVEGTSHAHAGSGAALAPSSGTIQPRVETHEQVGFPWPKLPLTIQRVRMACWMLPRTMQPSKTDSVQPTLAVQRSEWLTSMLPRALQRLSGIRQSVGRWTAGPGTMHSQFAIARQDAARYRPQGSRPSPLSSFKEVT